MIVVLSVAIFLANMTPGLKGSIDQELRIFFKQTDRIIAKSPSETLKNLFYSIKFKTLNEVNFQKLKINISFKNYQILQEERKNALKDGINESRKKVPINIVFNNENYKASARLKGVLTDHYGNNKQFSLMIKLKNGKSIDGMKEFSLTQHYSRQYPQNVIYSNLLSKLDVATPNFFTYKIDLNGDDWGLMLAEEQYSDAYFELRRKKYAPIIKFTNEDNSYIFRILLKQLKNSKDINAIDYLNFKHGKIENSFYNKKDFQNFYFENSISYINDLKYNLLVNKIPSSQYHNIFDMDKFSKIMILSILSGEYHPLGYRNIRFYFNPFNQKLEPIPTDWGELNIREIDNLKQLEKELDHLINCRSSCNRQDYPLYEKIFKNDTFLQKFESNLKKFKLILIDSNSLLNELCKNQSKKCLQNFKLTILEKNLQILINSINVKKLFKKSYIKIKNFDEKIENETKEKYFDIVKNLIYVRAFSNGELRIFNLTPFDLEINKISFFKESCKSDCSLNVDKKLLLPKSNFQYSTIVLNQNLINYETVQFDISHNQKLFKSSKFRIENQGYLAALNQEIYDLENIDIKGNNFIIKEGITEINRPLIIPENFNLKILPGSKLIFQKGTYISINGGNIEAIGDKDKKIYFEPFSNNDGWNGIYVRNSQNLSKFQNVVFEHVNYYKNFKTHLTGAINFYKADVDFIDTEFINSYAEDFLNITHSNFKIINSRFSNCKSDAFDSDFSDGFVENSEFQKIKGDAVDFSGSNVLIKNSKFNLVDDKAISAGESSKIISLSNTFSESNIAIAGKDRSIVKAKDDIFFGSKLYDVVAFNKKSFFEKGGLIDIKNDKKNIDLKIKSDFLSEIILNDVKIKSEKLNLDEIY